LQILTNKALSLLLLAAPVILATAKWVTAADETSRNMVGGTLLTDGYDQKGISAGFRLERYARLWERNPFAAVTPAAAQPRSSVLDKLFLASWLMVGGKEIIFVQNSETNEVQRITAETNQYNLRLVQIHLDPNPRLVQAVISDGMEQGTVKFQVDAGPSPAQTVSSADQTPNNDAAGETPKPAEASSRASPGPQANLVNAQDSDSPSISPVVPLAPHNNYYPGIQRVHSEGGRAPVQAAGKHVMPSLVPGKSN
jgi:hypothetical protein